MIKEEFIKQLEREGLEYKEESGRIIVNVDNESDLETVLLYAQELPENVTFEGPKKLYLLLHTKTLPEGTIFRNDGSVTCSVDSFHPSTRFENNGAVWLETLKEIKDGSEFNNKGQIYFQTLRKIGNDVLFHNTMGAYFINRLTDNLKNWNNYTPEGIDEERFVRVLINRGILCQ